jgi:YidC/Oxa1 family membrane protein insertase
MKSNYIVFFIVSILLMLGWGVAQNKGLIPGAPRSQAVSPQGTPAATADQAAPTAPGAPAAVRPTVIEERPIDFQSGVHKVQFNAHGASVLQWTLEEGADLTTLVLDDGTGERPFTAFPDLVFSPAPAPAGEAAFTAKRADGLIVRQSYKVDPVGFLHTMTLSLENTGKTPVEAAYELGWGPGIASGAPHGRKMDDPRALALEGDKLLTLKPGAKTGPLRWFAVDARYFMAAFLNDGNEPVTLRVDQHENKEFSVRRVEKVSLAPKEKKDLVQRFYLGPKSFDALASHGLGLEKAVNFGMFNTLGRWIHRALLEVRKHVPNFGWAIIVITFFVQLLVSPLTVSSFKHSQKMKNLQPQMKRLQEMYKSDPRRLNSEMLALYQRHGLRFMGLEGCLPMLVQMPVFFSLYAVLSKTFELRHTHWIGWIHDLSAADPYSVLPVLMGIAMFGQQKITAASADPSQRQMMYIMPIVFTVIFRTMPAGLVIYWLTNSLLTLALQLYLAKRHAAAQENAL